MTSWRKRACLAAVASTKIGIKLGRSSTQLKLEALFKLLRTCSLEINNIDGLITVPSLAEPSFMDAHRIATAADFFPSPRSIQVQTIDTGGAGPISALIQAAKRIENDQCSAIVVLAGDAVSTMNSAAFRVAADNSCAFPHINTSPFQTPVIPNAYDHVARWHLKKYNLERSHLAKYAAIMSHQAQMHPQALLKKKLTVQDILASTHVAPMTSVFECARKADGAVAILVTSSDFLEYHKLLSLTQNNSHSSPIMIIGTGEAAGPIAPPIENLSEDHFSCHKAAASAYYDAGISSPSDVDIWGIYDCFPICAIRALASLGIVSSHSQAARWIDERFEIVTTSPYNPQNFPINLHGGLLAFGAPWETPALYSVEEIFNQLTGNAGPRQLPDPKLGLVYGNGGVFSSSAIAIFAKS